MIFLSSHKAHEGICKGHEGNFVAFVFLLGRIPENFSGVKWRKNSDRIPSFSAKPSHESQE